MESSKRRSGWKRNAGKEELDKRVGLQQVEWIETK
jgi:hypothetical protein